MIGKPQAAAGYRARLEAVRVRVLSTDSLALAVQLSLAGTARAFFVVEARSSFLSLATSRTEGPRHSDPRSVVTSSKA